MNLKIILVALIAALPLTSNSASAQGKAVRIASNSEPGTIEIHVKERALYYIYESGKAIRYPVAVPKIGMQWSGYARVSGKYWSPAWTPPAIVKHDHPELPNYIPGGSPENPMGAAALILDRDEYAIHGTSPKMRSSIGTAASYGCIRMLNEDVTDLYGRVSVGTVVLMRN